MWITLRLIYKQMNDGFARIRAEIHHHAPKGFATEQNQLLVLEALEALRKEVSSNTKAVAEIKDLLDTPRIEIVPGEPKDKE